jgi:hypothetical protein
MGSSLGRSNHSFLWYAILPSYPLDDADNADDATFLAIWSIAEPGFGIIATSIATLRPLVRQIGGSIRGTRDTTVEGSTQIGAGSRFLSTDPKTTTTGKPEGESHSIASEDLIIQGAVAQEPGRHYAAVDMQPTSPSSFSFPKQGEILAIPNKQSKGGVNGWGRLSQLTRATRTGIGLPLSIFDNAPTQTQTSVSRSTSSRMSTQQRKETSYLNV